MNQVEIWFSILARKLLKRGNFISVADLKAKVLAFIHYFNRTMAKPFGWTYQGKALAPYPLAHLSLSLLVGHLACP